MYCCGSEGASQASAVPGPCRRGDTGPRLQARCRTQPLTPHRWGWALSTVVVSAVTPFPCSVTSSRDLMRVLMNLCPSFPSIMLLRIWGTWRRRLRATKPGHVPAGTHLSGVALGTHRVQGRGVSSLGGAHHAGTQGTVTQLPSSLWPHGSCAGALRTRRSPGQAGGAECPLQLQLKGSQPVPQNCPRVCPPPPCSHPPAQRPGSPASPAHGN